jgi:hypothetical protein
VDSPATGWNILADTTTRTGNAATIADDAAPTRRDFLLMAGIGAAGATLIRPSKLFAAAGAVKPENLFNNYLSH